MDEKNQELCEKLRDIEKMSKEIETFEKKNGNIKLNGPNKEYSR